MISSPSRALAVHVTARGRIQLMPAYLPLDVDADQADAIAAELVDAATRSRAILET